MFNKILSFSINQRWLVLLGVLISTLLGVYSFNHLPIDAVPDITNVQVQINTEAPGYSPLEIEQQVTFPIEFSLSGLPAMKQTRSLSRYGLSQVTVIFKEGTDIYFARQLLNQKLQEIRGRLPQGLEPQMGPIATGLGEIYMWTLEVDPKAKNAKGENYSLRDLRTLQDWVIKPQIKTVPGVTEVNTIGGHEKRFQISPHPEKLRSYGLSFHNIVQALNRNNQNMGAGYIERAGSQYLLRMPGRLKDQEGIKNILVATKNGVPVRIRDIAQVEWNTALRTGAATENGREAVLGTAVMLIGGNSQEVSDAVHERLSEINHTLPKGIKAVTVYNRSELVEKTIETVEENLFVGALLVIVILFLFLGNFRAALITALVIPFSMAFTITGMYLNKISANLMSLGALDFGIIVDGSVVIAENCLRHLSEKQIELGRALSLKERMNTVFEASKEARQALLFGEMIIMIVYLPILTLEGVEGKMFQPMALTVILALVGAMILSMTFIPAALAIFMTGKVQEKENRLVVLAKNLYEPSLKWSLKNKMIVLSVVFSLLGLSGLIATKLGREFVPNLNEGDMAIQALRVPGTGLEQSIKMQVQLEKALLTVPEVKRVFSRIGTAEVATDPMPPSIADSFIILKPRGEWTNSRLSHEELLKKFQEAIKLLKGNKYEFTQPIQMRFNELLSGVRADLGVKVFGDDMEVLQKQGQKIKELLERVPGAADLRVEQVSGLPVLTMLPKIDVMARYGIDLADVQEVLEIAGAGKLSGQIFEGDRRFDIVVRLSNAMREDISRLKSLPIPLPNNPSDFVPLSELAHFKTVTGPNQISRENSKRRIVVTANVRGRDLGGFVSESQERLKAELQLPVGYWLEWGGEFEKLKSATDRLLIVVPVALVIIMLLLYSTLKSVKDSLLVFSGIPLALTGGILALLVRGLPLSISAGIGFIALSGVAVLNGLVMLTFITQLREQGADLLDAITVGAMTRLRPVLMTAMVASLGFVPMAIATSTGSEVQRPLATVVIGGILSSTLLTLFVLPVLYALLHRSKPDTIELNEEANTL